MVIAFGITSYVLANFHKHNNELDFEPEVLSTENPSFSNNSSNNNTNFDSSESKKSTSPVSSDPKINRNDINKDLFPDTKAIFSNTSQWNIYFDENINLSSDFIALNNQGEEMDKEDFLIDLTSGSFAPIKLRASSEMYQLFDIRNIKNKNLSIEMSKIGDLAYAYYLKEGEKFPEFNFSDINGNEFSNITTQEKIIIITCWSISEEESTKEFSDLNKLYDKYEAFDDVVFLSITADKTSELLNFLTTTQLRHPVVADQRAYLEDQIEIQKYPTHIIVDEDGYIEKMLSNSRQLKQALKEIASPDLTSISEDGI